MNINDDIGVRSKCGYTSKIDVAGLTSHTTCAAGSRQQRSIAVPAAISAFDARGIDMLLELWELLRLRKGGKLYQAACWHPTTRLRQPPPTLRGCLPYF